MTDIDWTAAEQALVTEGHAVLSGLVRPEECASLAAIWDERARFRSEVIMARHGYGRGAYRYFEYPLPARIAELRASLYPPLASIRRISLAIAVSVADCVYRLNLARVKRPRDLKRAIARFMYEP